MKGNYNKTQKQSGTLINRTWKKRILDSMKDLEERKIYL